MRVVGLDGRSYALDLSVAPPGLDDDTHRSSYHLRARTVLKELFPVDRLLEELGLPGTGGLLVDFFLPLRRLVVEVQGEQHYRHTPFFHGDADGYARARRRDERKTEWCTVNGFHYVALPYDEHNEWRRLVIEATSGG